MRVFETDSGLSFNVRQDKCCVFCEHCYHIMYDSNGPYWVSCDKDNPCTEQHNFFGKCKDFEEEKRG